MNEKEVKEESLLPSVASIIAKHTGCPIDEVMNAKDTEPVNKIFQCIKEAMELTRDKTLELSAEKAKIDENESDLGRISFCVHKGSIISLKTSDKLKVH